MQGACSSMPLSQNPIIGSSKVDRQWTAKWGVPRSAKWSAIPIIEFLKNIDDMPLIYKKWSAKECQMDRQWTAKFRKHSGTISSFTPSYLSQNALF